MYFYSTFFHSDPQYRLDPCVLFIKLWEYKSHVNNKDSPTSQKIIYCITRYITPFNEIIKCFIIIHECFLKFSEHFFDRHELLSFTYIICCVKEYMLHHRKSF